MSTSRCRSKTIGINPSPDIINPQCSCPKCDSMSCFAKRHSCQPCTCDKCNNSKTCLFYTNNNVHPDESRSYANIEIKRNIEQDDTNENLKERIKKEYVYEYDKNTNTRTVTKKQSKFFYKNEGSEYEEYAKTEIINERAPTQVHSVAIKYSRKEVNPGTAKLSAQVMDVPYRDFKNSIYKNRSDVPAYKKIKLSKTDIFTRIKEAYKACSCKVCECILGASFIAKPNSCKCKPCECNNCVSFMDNVHYMNTVRSFPSDDCLYNRCDRSQSKGLVKKLNEPQTCDCKPCECIECCESFSKPCNCEPCQCVECKSMGVHKPKSLVVAQVGEDFHHNACQCSPCDCIECQHLLGLSSSLGHEMSTGINRHPNCHCETCHDDACEPDNNESCKCERRSRVMTKPVKRHSQDYDIRILLTNNNYLKLNNRKTSSTIAMFSSLSYTYPKLTSTLSKNVCSCNECECLVCKSQDNAVNSIKSSQLFTDNVKINEYERQEINNMGEDCKYEAWDCPTYDKPKTHNNKNNVTAKQISKFSPRTDCKCSPCKCKECVKDNIIYSGAICCRKKCSCAQCFDDFKDDYYPIKKGELLTPSIYKVKVNDGFNINHNTKSISMKTQDLVSTSFQSMPSLNDLIGNKSTKTTYQLLEQNDFLKFKRHKGHDKKEIQQSVNGYHTQDKSDIFKCDAFIQYPEKYIIKHTNKNQAIFSSYASTSKSSYSKENEIISLNSKVKHISWKSSRTNSSGKNSHDYSNQFPKTTVETCINDVMKFNLEKTLQLDRLNYGLNRGLTDFNNTHSEMIMLLDGPKRFRRYKSCYPQIHKTVSGIRNTNIENSDYDCDELNSKYGKYNCPCKESISRSFWLYETETAQNNIHINTTKTSENLLKHRKYFEKNFNDNTFCKRLANGCTAFDSSHDLCKRIHNTAPNNATNTTICDGYCNWKNYKRPLHSFVENNVDLFNIDPDYEGVQKTLRDARAFTFHLMTILEKYEKANREFVSISGKLKLSIEAVLSGSVKEIHEEPNMKTGFPQNDQKLKMNSFEKKIEHETQEIHLDFSENPIIDKEILELGMFQISEQQVNLKNEIVEQQFESVIITDNSDVNLPAAIIKRASSLNVAIGTQKGPDILQCHISTSSEETKRINKIKRITKEKNREIKSNNVPNLDADINTGVIKTPHIQEIYNNIIIQHRENTRIGVKDSQSNVNIEPENIDEIVSNIESKHKLIHEQSCTNIKNVEKNDFYLLHNATKLNVAKISSNEISQAVKRNERRCEKEHKKYKQLFYDTTLIAKNINEVLESKPGTSTTSVSTETETTIKPITTKNDEEINFMSQSTTGTRDTLKIGHIKKHKTQDLVKVDTVFGITKVIGSTLTDQLGKITYNENTVNTTLEENAQVRETELIEGQKLWSNRQKKQLIDCDPNNTEHRKVCVFPLIQKEVKETVQAIYLQNRREKEFLHKNKALAKLQVEVNKLLNLPLLQHCNPNIPKDDVEKIMDEPETNPRSIDPAGYERKVTPSTAKLERQIADLINLSILYPVTKKCVKVSNEESAVGTDTQIPIIGSSKSSCDGLKVSFLGLRRVSNHTVLVKWNVPQVLTNVQGYELLVDGRAVQKIFSPCRRMAVVTCLPHCDKILLTIRTITATIANIGHYPSATIVYRPRVK